MLGLKTFETTNDKRMSSYHLPVSSYSCFAILNSNKTKSSLKRKKSMFWLFPTDWLCSLWVCLRFCFYSDPLKPMTRDSLSTPRRRQTPRQMLLCLLYFFFLEKCLNTFNVFCELTKVCYVGRCSEEVSGTSFSNLGFGKTFFQLFVKFKKETTPIVSSPSYSPMRERNGPHQDATRSQSGDLGVPQLHAQRNWRNVVIVVFVPSCYGQRLCNAYSRNDP